jgi:RimJ/RimL family protein N-acetyltransferase
MSLTLPTHDIHLTSECVRLRPFTEADFDVVARWWDDPQVMDGAEGKENPRCSRAEIEDIYRSTAEKWEAQLFIIEAEGRMIGETWLQRMNMDRGKTQPPDNAWRIDIMIGEKACWGKGYGSETVRLLLGHAFGALAADRVAAMCVFEFNERSLRMFRACGMREVRRVPDLVERGGRRFAEVDLEITRGECRTRRG